jgi:hypothetical protein
MLPLIVVGADDTVTQALKDLPEAPEIIFYPSAEAAQYALVSELTRTTLIGTSRLVHWDDNRLGWQANVAYGPRALGPAAIGMPQRLAHVGWTLVLDHGITAHDPAAPRRVYEGVPEGEDVSTIVWQAAGSLHAHFVVDVTGPPVPSYPSPLVWVLTKMTERIEP